MRSCNFCLLNDEIVSKIDFDKYGQCSYCRTALASLDKGKLGNNVWLPNIEGHKKLFSTIEKMKSSKEGKYDCIVGLSGGLDSSFLVFKCKEWGLNPLIIHVDTGWNSELSVHNIECLISYTNFDLFTYVVDWKEMREVQKAFLNSGISNLDIPQDHIIFAVLRKLAVKHNVKYFMSGGNLATESILPNEWLAPAIDSWFLADIIRKFCKIRIKKIPRIGFFNYFFIQPFIHKTKTVRPLNLMKYDKKCAIDALVSIGWKPYKYKHGESRFTRLFQDYILIRRFGIDKRYAHLSSLIVSDQLTREEAYDLLKSDLYDEVNLENDIKYFIDKLHTTREEFEYWMTIPRKNYSDFKNWQWAYVLIKAVQIILQRLKIVNFLGRI